ncbi:MAG TPA: class I SAM-dependent rRNA methyltransferase [Blastocatellia bacterium]|nr:class I SAM-dependent rRNA methyltransferase [Blastocatellia bacterium]
MVRSQARRESKNLIEAVITPKGVERVRTGHLWIYRSDVVNVASQENGVIVKVLDKRGKFVAWAQYSAKSEITLRIISRTDYAESEVSPKFWREFWRERLLNAIQWRSKVVTNADSYRLVHGEADWMPGLIIDRYGDAFSIQTLTFGMDLLKPLWVELLLEQFNPRLIVERNDVKVRQLEGLPLKTGILHQASENEPTLFQITENGIKYWVDLIEGQKTGAFLDQRENRAATMRYASGRALDCFSFHGSFALHLAQVCDQVTALDISDAAIERARMNAELNGITNVEFIETNVFDRLREYEEAGERFDTIVLDPPAFAKNRGAVEAALRGYNEINLRAMKLLSPGGILITCSCSYHVNEELFLEMLMRAARDANRAVQLIEKRTQARDHPILLTMPETYYLKCIVLRVI